jgi:hypothetical protein
MKHVIIAVIVLLSVVTGIAAADPANQTSPTPENGTKKLPPGAPTDVDLVLDQDVAIVDWRYREGQFVLDVYSSDYTTMTVAAAPSGQGQQGSASFRTVALDEGKTTTVRITASNAVTLWTEGSVEENRWYYLRRQSSIIRGPYSGDDVTNAAFGSATGVALAVLITAVRAKIGATDMGERIA